MQNYPEGLPNEYRPLSAWAYFGYNLLFSIPLIGFILLIIFSFDSSNINRRNYARSFFCGLLLALIFAIIMIVLVAILGISLSSTSFDLTNL